MSFTEQICEHYNELNFDEVYNQACANISIPRDKASVN